MALLALSVLVAAMVIVRVRLPKLRVENQRKAEEVNLRLASDAIAFRLLTRVRIALQGLSRSSQVVDVATGAAPRDSADAFRVMQTTLAVVQADIVYIMERDGTVVACTPYNGGESLTGNNYAFRPYFKWAMEGRSVVYPALGVTTGKRGLYFSAPVLPAADADPAGVAVIKMGLDETDWVLGMFSAPACLVSGDGVVFSSNRDDWLYHAIRPLSPRARKRLQETQQFGGRRIGSLPFGLDQSVVEVGGRELEVLSAAGPLSGWRLVSLMEPDPHFPLTEQQTLFVRLLIGVAALIVLTAIVVIVNVALRRRAEQRYRYLVENMNEAIAVIRDERIIFCNRRLGELLGCSREDLQLVYAGDLVHPEDREMAMGYHRERLEGRPAPDRYEVRLVNRHSDTVWVLLSAVRIDWQQRPATLLFLVDVSEQKKLQMRLSQAARMEAIGQLAGGIAHDFNNLLVGILGNAELLRHKVGDDGERVRFATSIETAAKRAAELTGQLLGFARRGRHLSEPVDFHRIVHESVELLERTVGKSVTVETALNADNPHVLGAPSQLKQIILNLGINARDAMPEGGSLTLATEDLADGVVAGRALPRNDAGWLELRVSDTGCGIPERYRDRVFEPFFTTKSAGKGTGLGLAMVYGIVSNHNGTIVVDSSPGVGATFRICLPACADRETAAADDADDEEGEALAGRHVMVVDDETIVLNVASSILEGVGCRVSAFSTGSEAVTFHARHAADVDITVLDMEMPGMDGGECYRQLRNADPHVRVLLSTGYGLNGKAQDLLNDGMVGLVQKPYQSADLCRAVRQALSQ